MINLINAKLTNAKLTGRSGIASCLPSLRLDGTGVSGVERVGGVRLVGAERPMKAPAAVVAHAQAYASAFAATGAGEGSQKQQHTMWAFRGHEPWRDPA